MNHKKKAPGKITKRKSAYYTGNNIRHPPLLTFFISLFLVFILSSNYVMAAFTLNGDYVYEGGPASASFLANDGQYSSFDIEDEKAFVLTHLRNESVGFVP